ncbi:MAG: UDP-N-acetylmuramoyl-L-alanine--D-glutamate ligase, partial [Betaproteobacteria bacterium]
VLNISEDHLDRYTGMDDYTAAKARVFQGAGVMVLNRDDPRSAEWSAWKASGRNVVSFGLNQPVSSDDYGIESGWIVRGGEKLIGLDALRIVGFHNAANAMAALALCEAVGVTPKSVLSALAQFTGLAHRVELVAEINGVCYYDDSKGTNVGATLAAVQGMGRKVAIILGGEGKGQDFSPLREALLQHGRAVALIGRDTPLIEAAIEGCGVPTRRCTDMDDAVRWCAAQARNGDAVLLSPACASLDMFRNYAHRAEVFISVVRALEQRRGEC